MSKNTKKSKSHLGQNLINSIERKNIQNIPQNLEKVKFIHLANNIELNKHQNNLLSKIDQDTIEDYVNQKANEIDQNKQKKITKSDLEARETIIKVEKKIEQQYNFQNNNFIDHLRIPRKPKWTKDMKKEQLIQLEYQSFIEWRKILGKIEEENINIQITPYEKNIEVWKQLWRVMERSDIIVQILDGRDPLFYRCQDIEAYTKEISQDKLNFLLINKSDLLSDQIREQWSKYFNENNIDHMFFSALEQQKLINQKDEKPILNLIENNEEIITSEFIKQHLNKPNLVSTKILIRTLKYLVQQIKQKKGINQQIEEQDEDFFIDAQEEQKKNENKVKQNVIQIGMVGYPNVGKSSVINTLCNKKLVAVGNMPGKTKNFQTHFLEENLLLCDCPGLVFPNAGSTKAEMACNGVLPIDKIKDCISPVELFCQRIPKNVLEKVYKIKFMEEFQQSKYVTAETFLSQYATSRGFYTGNALPDQARSAKIIIKDLLAGKLLFCKLPPGYNDENIWQFNPIETEVKEHEETKENNIKEEEVQKEQNQKIINKQEKNINVSKDELMLLLIGKKVKGIKLDKHQIKIIKQKFQRGEIIDLKQELYNEQINDFICQ